MASLEELRSRLHNNGRNGSNGNHVDDFPPSQCPYCGSNVLITDWERGEVVCPSCGSVVVDRLIDVSHPEYLMCEKRLVDLEDLQHYEVTSPLHVFEGLGGENVDVHVRRLHLKLIPTSERVFIEARIYAGSLIARAGLPRGFLYDICRLFRLVYNELKSNRKRAPRIKAIVLVLLDLVARSHGYGSMVMNIIKSELASNRISSSLFSQTYSKVREILHRKGIVFGFNIEGEARNMINMVLDKLGIMGEKRAMISRLALDIVKKAYEVGIARGKPLKGTVGAAVYAACNIYGLKITQKDIARMLHMSDVSLRQRYRELVEKLEFEINI